MNDGAGTLDDVMVWVWGGGVTPGVALAPVAQWVHEVLQVILANSHRRRQNLIWLRSKVISCFWINFRCGFRFSFVTFALPVYLPHSLAHYLWVQPLSNTLYVHELGVEDTAADNGGFVLDQVVLFFRFFYEKHFGVAVFFELIPMIKSVFVGDWLTCHVVWDICLCSPHTYKCLREILKQNR